MEDPDEPAWEGSVGDRGDVFFLKSMETIEYDQETIEDPGKSEQPMALHNGSLSSPDLGKDVKQKVKKGAKKKGKRHGSGRNKDVRVTALNNGPTNGNKVTFNDVPTGLTREVVMSVDPSRHNYGRRSTLCESVLGIVAGTFHKNSHNDINGTYRDKRIMVQGMLPDGEAIRHGIKIGEWLMAVNDLEVDFENIDSILCTITGPKDVKLTVQKVAIQATPKPVMLRKPGSVNNSLVKLISGERLHEEPLSFNTFPNSVLYLTMDCESESMKGREDILYQFPKHNNKLVEVRGAFITLSQMLVDITNNTAKNSTLLCKDHLVHIGYKRENREVLVLAVPAIKLSVTQLNHILKDCVRLLQVLYGSLHRAFTRTEHRLCLDHFFVLVLQRFLLAEEMLKRGTKQTEYLEPFFDILAGIRTLTMPEETKVVINNCLSELEAADFADMSDDYYGLRRMYVIQGSCLFYKGYLLASHLHKEDLMDIYLYLRYYYLLTLCNEEQLGQLVVWKEIFPYRRCHQQVDPTIPGYMEPEARWFLMVVGLRNAMVGVLLEAGGCAAWADGNPPPDPFCVDQTKATVLQMEALDVFNQCEIRLQGPPMPSLACADWFLPAVKKPNADQKAQGSPRPVPIVVEPSSKKVTQPESILKKPSVSSPQTEAYRYRGAMHEVESEADSLSTGTSEGSNPRRDWRSVRKASMDSEESEESRGNSSLFKGSRRRRNLLSLSDVGEMRKNVTEGRRLDDEECGSLVKLSTGCDNTIFHYLHLDTLEGVFLCPTQQELLQVTSDLQSAIMRNFQQACLAIKKLFDHSESVKALADSGAHRQFGLDTATCNVTEHGMLFQCSLDSWSESKKSAPVLTYWVVGRRIQDPYRREFYACFHDSAQQNLVEMAFKLGFGLGL